MYGKADTLITTLQGNYRAEMEAPQHTAPWPNANPIPGVPT
jgi:hypothetical protein